jgi:hypothetical protein
MADEEEEGNWMLDEDQMVTETEHGIFSPSVICTRVFSYAPPIPLPPRLLCPMPDAHKSAPPPTHKARILYQLSHHLRLTGTRPSDSSAAE